VGKWGRGGTYQEVKAFPVSGLSRPPSAGKKEEQQRRGQPQVAFQYNC